MALRILHTAAEIQPLIKTGGLADVLGSLPPAQQALGHDVAVLIPGYPAVREQLTLNAFASVDGGADGTVVVLRGELPGTDLPLLVLDAPRYFDRPGSPYGDPSGQDWPDNYRRFALLARVAATLVDTAWPADVLHAHDWHAGLAAAWLRARDSACASCFTIHNLAYQGVYDAGLYPQTGLPYEYFSLDGLEFYDRWSFMKAALYFSDAITTVSPGYAREILGPAFGMGLDGLLRHRAASVHGILNGVDYRAWDPASDPALSAPYSALDLSGKHANRLTLQRTLGLATDESAMLVGVVSRLTTQKGLDLAVRPLHDLLGEGRLQLALLGSGEPGLEAAYQALAAEHPGRCAVRLGYDENLAHRIFGGADIILVPSRFEPCGLTQLYGLRYGTLPLVRRTGGLADTVRGYTPSRAAEATGFTFDTASELALQRAFARALAVHADRANWEQLMHNAMQRDFGWDRSARAYLELYAQLAA